MSGTRARGKALAVALAAAVLLGTVAIAPAYGVDSSYKPQYLESPLYALNDHTGFGLRWAALAGSGLPAGQYYVKMVVTDTESAATATIMRGFTWNEVTQVWVQAEDPTAAFQTITAASDGSVANDWVYGKIGDEELASGSYYVQVVLTSVTDGTVYYPDVAADLGSGIKGVTVLDPATNGGWVHNGTDRSDTYTDADVTGKRVTVFSSNASTTNNDSNFPPTAPTATLYSLWECQFNLIDDDANGVVDDEAYGPTTRTIGDYRVSVPLDTTVDIYVNRNQTAKGGLRIDDFQTSAVADTDVAIGASEIIPPTKVIDLAATPVTTSVNLAWTAATDAGGSGLAGYRVYRWETPASGLHYTPAPACIATIAPDATTYIDSTVAYGKQYHYELRAFDSATNVGPRSNAVAVTALTPAMTAVYRFYNVRTGSHFYTASAAERAHVNATWPTIFTDEGVAYTADPWKNTQPLYRFYNVRTQSHFYTASAAERAHVNATWPTTFSDEGVAYNVSTTSGIPVYRFYNVRTGSHFYTASAAERAHVNATWPTIFSDEGVAYYLAQ